MNESLFLCNHRKGLNGAASIQIRKVQPVENLGFGNIIRDRIPIESDAGKPGVNRDIVQLSVLLDFGKRLRGVHFVPDYVL